jgi:nitroimidazol reductase NimA-like FMN-containing flavoprotein (pyridoxamine 5'-phosphate oxidase superfamily)
MIDELSPQETESLLESQLIGRLACHADGITYVVPMSFAYDGQYIYGHAREGMKVDMMRKNPSVCFQTDNMENMANWQSVIIWGEFEELKKSEERSHALQKLMNRVLPVISSQTTHLSPDWPFPPKDINSIKGVVFRIKIQKKTGRFEKSNMESFFAS